MKTHIFLVLISLTITSCQFRGIPAPISFNHDNSNLRNDPENIPIISNENIHEPIQDTNSEIIHPNKHHTSSNQETSPESKDIIYHKVELGETIHKIAKKYNTTIEQITTVNELEYPDLIQESQILKINNNSNNKLDSIALNEVTTKKTTEIQNNKTNTIFLQPVQGNIISKFGNKTTYGINKGINIAAKEGTKITSSTDGNVLYADYDATFGYLVIIKTPEKNTLISYAHMEDLIVVKGQKVKQGEAIGYVGRSGKVDSYQLHFAIREGKIAKDPEKLLNKPI